MAEISVDFRNIAGAKKCAVSSPRIVSLEIEAESPGGASESAFNGHFLNGLVSCSDIKSDRNLIYGCDKNVLIHSQSPLSKSTCDDRPSNKIKSTDDNDFDLRDLLNSVKKAEAVESGVGNINSQKNTADDKMKVSNVEESGGLSDLLSSISYETLKKNEVNTSVALCQPRNTRSYGIDLLDFDFTQNEGVKDSLPSNNSSLKVEGNLSDLLSSLNIGDSEGTNVGNFKSSNWCNLKIENKIENEPNVTNLSDLLSSIDLGNSTNDSCNQNDIKVIETKNESCLADFLQAADINKPAKTILNNKPLSFSSSNLFSKGTNGVSDSLNDIAFDVSCSSDTSYASSLCNSKVLNKLKIENEPNITNISDLLSSIDFGNSANDSCNQNDIKVIETKNESCLADFLQVADSDKPAMTVLSNKPLSFGSSNLFPKGTNGVSDSLNDIAFDVSCSSDTSYASSLSETEESDNSPKNSLTKTTLTDKVLEYDSSYGSLDSARKGFSFFDYSSDNQISLNSLLINNSSVNKALKNYRENADEEMSMSDLLTIVSPDFKNPVLTTLNKVENFNSRVNGLNMLDLMESLSIKSKDSDCDVKSYKSLRSDEKLMNFDRRISENVPSGIEAINSQANGSLEKDILMDRSDVLNDGDKITSEDDQITFIDLRECIKSAKHKFTPKSPIKQVKSVENQSLKCVSPNKIQFHCGEKSLDLSQNSSNPFEFNAIIPKKKIKVNSKQTMFSKALACKPKKDQFLLQKVANIKNELLRNIISRPVFIDCDVPPPVVESVLQSDRCIFSNISRTSFGLDTQCELQ